LTYALRRPSKNCYFMKKTTMKWMKVCQKNCSCHFHVTSISWPVNVARENVLKISKMISKQLFWEQLLMYWGLIKVKFLISFCNTYLTGPNSCWSFWKLRKPIFIMLVWNIISFNLHMGHGWGAGEQHFNSYALSIYQNKLSIPLE